jgi:hypothetical protein
MEKTVKVSQRFHGTINREFVIDVPENAAAEEIKEMARKLFEEEIPFDDKEIVCESEWSDIEVEQ